MNLFPPSSESKLGFDVLRDRLRSFIRSPLGEDRLDAMRPSSDEGWIRGELERVGELQNVFRFDDPMPLQHVLDVRAVVERAVPAGALIDPPDLADLRRVLITLRRLHGYFESRRDKYGKLWDVVSRISPLPDLEERIDEVVDEEARVRDTASPELQRIRRLIIRRQAELREALQRALRSAMAGGHATEEQPTIRNGRMVIPVRAEAKRKVQGFVQDTSASGQTVYIEPSDCLDLNNEVRELEGEEGREIERILRALTSEVRSRLDPLREGLRVLAAFDLLQAKARFANDIDATAPVLNADGVIDVVEGRNPLLLLHFRGRSADRDAEERPTPRGEQPPEASTTKPSDVRPDQPVTENLPAVRTENLPGVRTENLPAVRDVVPLNLRLGSDYRTLIITGPNAGGKTVAMKTVGLFALMLSYGLPLPVDDTSRFSVFDRLYVDIGDEQSIEEDLSTFSSHVSNLRYMLEHADRRTLVLIDEAGTGTDPAEGGALAQAVLERLTERRARTIATTHHGTLKVFAHETEGVENGSMEFDQATLSPTYRFQSGIPGSSYAFEIARRIGMDPAILERARALVGEQKTALEELITTFESRTQELDARLAEAEESARHARHERDQYRRRTAKLDRQREEIRRQALEEAERIVAEANARIERTIREIKEADAEREATLEARRELESFRENVHERLSAPRTPDADDDRAQESAPEERERPTPVSGAIEVGDQVVLDDGSTAAEVLEIDDGEAVISFDSMRIRAGIERLTKVGGKREQKVRLGKVEQGSTGGMTSLTARSRVDLRGRRVQEALEDVERLIDEALVSRVDHVEILHGKGTGALRQAIHDYLAERADVVSFEEAPWDQGGAGVTYVHLR